MSATPRPTSGTIWPRSGTPGPTTGNAQADQREAQADQREARLDGLLRDWGLTTASVQQRAQEAITWSRELIARSAAATDRCEARLKRQAQRAGREQSDADRDRPRPA